MTVESRRVLVVEDDDDLRQIIVDSLIDQGYVARAVADGAAGLAAANAEPFDLIVTDVVMPRLSGVALALAVKDGPLNAQTPVLIITGTADMADVAAATPTIPILLKPFSAAALLRAVARLV